MDVTAETFQRDLMVGGFFDQQMLGQTVEAGGAR
jgi:hypothetical protein